MKTQPILTILALFGLALALIVSPGQAQGPDPQGDGSVQATLGTAPSAALGTGFTYQGQLKSGGNPVNGNCDFQFSLWDAASGGSQVSTTQTKTSVAVSNGYFTIASLDFGSVFTGAARWLAVAVRCPAGSGTYTMLSPRQALTAAPYALGLRPGAFIQGSVGFGGVVNADNTSTSLLSWGVGGTSAGGMGVYGKATATSGTTTGVWGESNSPEGRGVAGYATATSGEAYGVYGESDSSGGVGVYAVGPWRGVVGYATATSSANIGVYGESASGTGVGVYGRAPATSGTNFGVYGVSASPTGIGVYGNAPDSGAGSGPGFAGYFWGDVHVDGTLSKAAGGFRIDHPLDPANRYLNHSFVESPDMKNIYDGVVLLDARGEAWVRLPEWFEALNQDFRYQLTAIGAPMPNLYIAQEIQGNSFQIAGGVPGMKVSWQVTGIRHDPFAEQNRIPVEVDKPADERGTYLYPAGYGQPPEMGLDYQRHHDLLERQPETPAAQEPR